MPEASHVPWPLQPAAHVFASHAGPVLPFGQRHVPCTQTPTPLQLKGHASSGSGVSHPAPPNPERQSQVPSTRHSPRPEHMSGHVRSAQPSPVWPSAQRQWPRTHKPPFSHDGEHTCSSHDSPVKPLKQVQKPWKSHLPLPWQRCGQSGTSQLAPCQPWKHVQFPCPRGTHGQSHRQRHANDARAGAKRSARRRRGAVASSGGRRVPRRSGRDRCIRLGMPTSCSPIPSSRVHSRNRPSSG